MTSPSPHHYPLSSLALILMFVASPAVALDSDRDQPVEINSEEAELDFKTGTRILIGSVTINQGTMKIEADRIEAQFENDELVSAIATGNPVYFHQQPEGKKEYVIGKSQRALLDQRKNTITLIERASLKQDKDLVTGETIIYDRGRDKLQIKGGMKGQFSSSAENKTTNNEANKSNPATQQSNSTKPTAPNSELTTYTVRRGDTACRIANTFSVDCRTLIKLNKLGKNALIKIGQKLVIPGSGRQEEPPISNNTNTSSSTADGSQDPTPPPSKSSEESDSGRARLVIQPGSAD